jgi:galactokinase
VASGFADAFGHAATVVGRAPGRVNLIGEHTDYNGGLCLPTTLPHATYAAVAAREDDRVLLASAREATPWEGSVGSLGPGTVTGWAAYVAGVLWALREDGVELPGVEVYVDGTVPLGSGLSSSAALECAVAAGVCGLLGLELTEDLRLRLVAACMRAEAEVAGAPTGGMDQTVSLLGSEGAGLLIDFTAHTTAEVPLGLEEAGLRLLVVDTRVSHALTDGGYASRRADCEEAAALLGIPSLRYAQDSDVGAFEDPRIRRRVRHVVGEIARVEQCVAALDEGDWARVGTLFRASHASLRDDFEVSCTELDATVNAAEAAGAIGARMTGGGFGGSAIALVPEPLLHEVVAGVSRVFAERGWAEPGFLLATPSPPAGTV